MISVGISFPKMDGNFIHSSSRNCPKCFDNQCDAGQLASDANPPADPKYIKAA